MKAQKTNAMRILDKAKISYVTKEYIFDEKDFSGEKVALEVGMNPKCVFKTILLRTDKKEIVVCCIPVNQEINLKRLATQAGAKKVEMTHVNELLAISGYVRGGCSPVGMKKKYRTFFEKSALDFEKIAVSAGVRGMQMILNPKELIEFTDAVLYDNGQE
jgi:Cys-tRNA(Pro)/Cys-tRNA(Cys) deacylase